MRLAFRVLSSLRGWQELGSCFSKGGCWEEGPLRPSSASPAARGAYKTRALSQGAVEGLEPYSFLAGGGVAFEK